MKAIRLLALALCLMVSGCAYNRYNAEFFAGCRAQLPAVRAYAIAHLVDLSDSDKQIINSTEPKLAQANWVAVDFTWPGVCHVNTGAPPDCQPFTTTDLRRIEGGGRPKPESADAAAQLTAQIKAQHIPCGTYAPARVWTDALGRIYTNNALPIFTLRLETNGVYIAESRFPESGDYGDRVSMTRNFEQSGWHWQAPDREYANRSYTPRNIHRGKWHWEPFTKEFVLEPGSFTFYIARLPVDPTNPNRLPLGPPNQSGQQEYLERVENPPSNH